MGHEVTDGRLALGSVHAASSRAVLLAIAVIFCLAPVSAVATTQLARTDAVLELTVVSDAPPEGVRWGSEVGYEFHLTNTGPLPVTQIVLSDTLCGDVGTVERLDPGQGTVLYATCTITGTGVGQATASGLDPNDLEVVVSTDHMVEVYIAHDWPDYSVHKRAGSDHAAPGEIVTFIVTIRSASNEGGELGKLELVDTFDPSLASVDSAPGGTVEDGTIVWRLDGFSASEGPRTVEYRLRISDTAPPGQTLRNTAEIGMVGGQSDIAPQDNTSTASILISLPAEENLPYGSGLPPDTPSSGTSGASGTQMPAAGDPYLPFTGMPLVAALIAAVCASIGTMLRVFSHRI